MYFRCVGEDHIYCIHLKAGHTFIIHNHLLVPTFILNSEAMNNQRYGRNYVMPLLTLG
jgi:hypothetical protein